MVIFSLGRLIVSKGVDDLIQSSELDLRFLLVRYMRGDWGGVDEEDQQTNNAAVKRKLRIKAIYEHNGQSILFITEKGHKTTNITLLGE